MNDLTFQLLTAEFSEEGSLISQFKCYLISLFSVSKERISMFFCLSWTISASSRYNLVNSFQFVSSILIICEIFLCNSRKKLHHVRYKSFDQYIHHAIYSSFNYIHFLSV